MTISSKTIFHGTLEGGQRKGRQRKCWRDEIRNLRSLPMPELLTMASCSTTGWKRISAKLSVTSPRRPNQSRDWNELNWCKKRKKKKKKENTRTESNNNINTYIQKEKKHSTHEIRENMTLGAAIFLPNHLDHEQAWNVLHLCVLIRSFTALLWLEKKKKKANQHSCALTISNN